MQKIRLSKHAITLLLIKKENIKLFCEAIKW